MVRRPLGSTGLEVSVLGLGTVKIGRNRGVKYPGGEGFALPTDREVEELLDTALSLGINLLDTAPAYGSSEERLGTLLGARRERFVIVTKVGEEFDGTRSTWDFSPRAVEESVERSLRRLRTDRVEGVLLHCPHDDLASLDALETLDRLKRKGLIRFVGASTYSVEAGLRAVERSDVVMLEPWPVQRPVMRRAKEAGKGVLLKKALGSGHRQASAEVFGSLLGKEVASAIVGTLNPDHLRQNALLVEEALEAP
jgi:aryl-alcohol dehydrogenase-like predicted oxidoreductase